MFPQIQRLLRPTPADQTTRQAEQQRKAEPGRGEAKDEVTLSSEALELLNLQKAAFSTPDIRVDRVSELRAAIQKGTYDVPADKIADRMLNMWGEKSGR